jgi:hypothetical protein
MSNLSDNQLKASMRVGSLMRALDSCSPGLLVKIVDSETFETLPYRVVEVESIAGLAGESHVVLVCVNTDDRKVRL